MAGFISRKRKTTYRRPFSAKRRRFTRRAIPWTRKPRRRRNKRRVKVPTRSFIVRSVAYIPFSALAPMLHQWKPDLEGSVPTAIFSQLETAKRPYEQFKLIYFKRTIRRNVPETLTGSGTESKYFVYTGYDPDANGHLWVHSENNFLKNQRTKMQPIAPFGSSTAFLRPRFARAPGGANMWGKGSGALWIDSDHTKAFIPSSMNAIHQYHTGIQHDEQMQIMHELKFVCRGFKGTQVYQT